jgi:HAD superfamily hydrolase (TIGR01509 family)
VTTIVVFDLGKVLVDFDYSIAARKIAAQSQTSLAEIKVLIEQSRFVIDFETGRLTRQEFYERVREATGFRGTLREFGEFFADIFTEMPAMTALQAELRQRGVPTYIFSNTNDLAIEHVRRSFPFFRNFDGYIFSYEVGTMKPDPAIYAALEKLSGRHGADIVYLDDRPENVAGGAARGWRAILQETPEKTRAAVEKLKLV